MKNIIEQTQDLSFEELLELRYNVESILFEKFREEYPVGSRVMTFVSGVKRTYMIYDHFIDERSREIKLRVIRFNPNDETKTLGTGNLSPYNVIKI